jgi:hypothetical protein
MTTLVLLLLVGLDVPSPPGGDATCVVWLADLHPERITSGIAGGFVFIPDSRPDEGDGCVGSRTRDHPRKAADAPVGISGAGRAGRDVKGRETGDVGTRTQHKNRK